MSDDLCQNGLSLVTQGLERSVITMSRELLES